MKPIARIKADDPFPAPTPEDDHAVGVDVAAPPKKRRNSWTASQIADIVLAHSTGGDEFPWPVHHTTDEIKAKLIELGLVKLSTDDQLALADLVLRIRAYGELGIKFAKSML